MKTFIFTIAALCATSNAFYMVKSGFECKSKDSFVGKYNHVSLCAAATKKKGGKFFIFGAGNKYGKCYMEKTKSAACAEGWERDSYDFYTTESCPPGVLCFKGWTPKGKLGECQGDCD